MLYWSAATISCEHSTPSPEKPTPERLCLMAQSLELWRTSGQKPGHYWPSTRSATGGLLLLFVPRHHMTHPAQQLPRKPIRDSGLLGSTGWGWEVPLRTITGMQPCLPHCQPPGTALAPPALPSSKHPRGARHSIQSIPQTAQCTAPYGNKIFPALLLPFPLIEMLPCHEFNVHIFKKKFTIENTSIEETMKGFLMGKGEGLCFRQVHKPLKLVADFCVQIGVFSFQVRESIAFSTFSKGTVIQTRGKLPPIQGK